MKNNNPPVLTENTELGKKYEERMPEQYNFWKLQFESLCLALKLIPTSEMRMTVAVRKSDNKPCALVGIEFADKFIPLFCCFNEASKDEFYSTPETNSILFPEENN